MAIRDKVVAYAKSQIGVCEPNGDDKYIAEFNRLTGYSLGMNVAWCACYATCCLRGGGLPEDSFGNFSQCTVALSWAKKKKIWFSRLTGHQPKPGELILFDWDLDGVPDHVGVVKSSTTNTVYTIEGNAKGGYAIDGVREKTYSSTSKYILGYIDIQYPDEVASESVKDTTITPVGNKRIKEIQTLLNVEYGSKLDVDGICGPKTKRALIKAIQTEINNEHNKSLAVDGVWGPRTRAAFPNVKVGCAGGLVKLVQCSLVIRGADIVIDGIYGVKTRSATEAYQIENKLVADGIVGPNTISTLMK